MPMSEHPDPDHPLRRFTRTDPQLHALEYLLNVMSNHGLRVQRLDSGQWQWEWQGQTGLSDGLGSAVVDAQAWFFELMP